eukprot:TRINITY_DN17358_c0_g1_i1.p1 TRINITY_DN17358_c0_g1~~TRINITY_DN17358_c0_g1_i1.p1  ORF type:complete len:1046 (+),score=97.50 TRINITY_DN17358_c0_g1_i1:54-3191(+)
MTCWMSHSCSLMWVLVMTVAADKQECSEKYYKIADEVNGLASSCSPVDQTADPVRGVGLAGCQAACDELTGCNTVNFRVTDPNFVGNSTCYRKQCSDFKTAVCTLFTLHKNRDVYTKACGAPVLWPQSAVLDSMGLFHGMSCPSQAQSDAACAQASTRAIGQYCAERYFKIADEVNGLASSCAPVEQTADPVRGMDLVGCQAACDALDGCNTVNFRVTDPNFGGNSTCYRKQCSDFKTAVCTLFTLHKNRDVYTKANGAASLWDKHVELDSLGLFSGMRCKPRAYTNNTGAPVCERWATTNQSSNTCDVCWEWSRGDGALSSARDCMLWSKSSPTSVSMRCEQYSRSSLEKEAIAQRRIYLEENWPNVGLCNQQYTSGTVCTVTRQNRTCSVRDQVCHGEAQYGKIAGVLSAGWQVQPSVQDRNLCTMCPRGTYGHCDNACGYRSNFYWSNFGLGKIDIRMTPDKLLNLYQAFLQAQREETDDIPQELKFTDNIVNALSHDHPLRNLTLGPEYSVIQVGGVMITRRSQILQLARTRSSSNALLVLTISDKGVPVYSTCECSSCPRGKFQDALGKTSCKACDIVISSSSTEDLGATGPEACACLMSDGMFEDEVDGKPACLSCSWVRSGQKFAQGCPCPIGHYREFRALDESMFTCRACPIFHTTDEPDAHSDEECRLKGEFVVALNASAIALCLIASALFLSYLVFRRRIRKLEAAREKEMHFKLEEGLKTLTEFGHPMVLIAASDFLLREVSLLRTCHEGLRDIGGLRFIDSFEEFGAFARAGNKVLFYSYQWLSWDVRGPDDVQFKAMRHVIPFLLSETRVKMEKLYVWLDILAIPQKHPSLKQLAVDSLYSYAGAAHFLVIIAPESAHANLGLKADASSYKSRVWTRVEQLSHAATKGFSSIWLYAGGENFTQVEETWVRDAVNVFDGEMTCCRLKHAGGIPCDRLSLVATMVGLFYDIYVKAMNGVLDKEGEILWNMMKDDLQRVFPQTVRIDTETGVQEAVLFGDMIGRVRLYVENRKASRAFYERASSRRAELVMCDGH